MVDQSLSGLCLQEILKTAVGATSEPSAFGAYVRGAVLHSLAVRLKESFLQVGRGDERQVIMHVQLPIQFSQAGDPVITVCEVGAFGDGTTRSFVERFEEAARHWTDGFIGACPNAREDAVLQRFFERSEEHTSELQSLMRTPYAV